MAGELLTQSGIRKKFHLSAKEAFEKQPICPIYFEAFDFEEHADLKQYQFFKPDGARYRYADKGTGLCFAHLVKFHNVNGVNLPNQDASRKDYLLDLRNALQKALDEKFQ